MEASKENPSSSKLSHHWNYVTKEYKLLSVSGEGSFGKVIRAVHRTTKATVAIKFIACRFNDKHSCRYIIRELSILRQFASMSNNRFINRLVDVIVAKKEGEKTIDAQGIFLVMEFVSSDLNNVLERVKDDSFTE